MLNETAEILAMGLATTFFVGAYIRQAFGPFLLLLGLETHRRSTPCFLVGIVSLYVRPSSLAGVSSQLCRLSFLSLTCSVGTAGVDPTGHKNFTYETCLAGLLFLAVLVVAAVTIIFVSCPLVRLFQLIPRWWALLRGWRNKGDLAVSTSRYSLHVTAMTALAVFGPMAVSLRLVMAGWGDVLQPPYSPPANLPYSRDLESLDIVGRSVYEVAYHSAQSLAPLIREVLFIESMFYLSAATLIFFWVLVLVVCAVRRFFRPMLWLRP